MRDLGNDPGCQLCTAASSGAPDELVDGATLVDVGTDVLVLVHPESHELVVAPVCHVATLGAVPGGAIGELLAAVRRLATVVQGPEKEVRIEPRKELMGSEGHLCIQVVPNLLGEGPSPFANLESLIKRVCAVLH